MSDQPWREAWDRQAAGWVELTTDDPYYELLNRPQFLELVPAPRGLTLDVGCGEGRMARELSARGHRVLGVDGSPALARSAARHVAPIAAAVGDCAAITAPRETNAADELVAEHPELANSQRVPDFLYLRAQRVDCDGLG